MLTKEFLKKKFFVNDKACTELLKALNLFSRRTRFRTLCILLVQNFCVSDIAEIVEKEEISHISQQLKILPLSIIISRYRVKKRVFYKLKDNRKKDIVEYLQQEFM